MSRLSSLGSVALLIAGTASLAACGSGSSDSSSSSQGGSSSTSSASTGASDSSSPSTGSTSGSSSPSTAAGASGSSTSASSSASGKTFTMAQVATHKTANSCYTVIDKNVYDLTSWIQRHPGGSGPIKALCGTNGTAKFTAKHGDDGPNGEPQQALASMKIGTLAS